MRAIPARSIAKKRDGADLDRDEVHDLVAGVVDGSLEDVQLGALLMAMFWRGAGVEEIAHWTEAMRDSGQVLRLDRIPGRKVDKHSTGGVGDKISLVLAPLVAACGVPVPMVSGRGLGHTGGTVDKLESIPGFQMQMSTADFERILSEVGLVMAAATDAIAPADRRMYAARDVTGTVESIPLITASILAKKLASGLDALVLDVKCGRGAFMKNLDDARSLARSLVETSERLGCPARALVTDMDRPLGLAIGNALEVREALQCLQNGGPEDVRELTLELGTQMLLLGERCEKAGDARALLETALDDGSALERFGRMVAAQGGDPRLIDEPDDVLPKAPETGLVQAKLAGPISDFDPERLAWVALELGTGRRHQGATIDPAVGLELLRRPGDLVERGDPVVRVHARTEAQLVQAREALLDAIQIGPDVPESRSLVLDRIG